MSSSARTSRGPRGSRWDVRLHFVSLSYSFRWSYDHRNWSLRVLKQPPISTLSTLATTPTPLEGGGG